MLPATDPPITGQQLRQTVYFRPIAGYGVARRSKELTQVITVFGALFVSFLSLGPCAITHLTLRL